MSYLACFVVAVAVLYLVLRNSPANMTTRWVPPGETVRIGARSLPDGMLHVGTGLPSVDEHRGAEPSLIDPALPLNDSAPDHSGERMDYWPSFSRIQPESRSAYLDWLASGRSDPNVGIGYVFLFFYGLERRLLHDTLPTGSASSASARSEQPKIIEEVERLLVTYGRHSSYLLYATALLDFIRARLPPESPLDSPREYPNLGNRPPLEFRCQVAGFAERGTPLPGLWALAWVRLEPEIRLRTPAIRCRAEFEALFLIAYRDRFNDGLRLKTCKRRIQAVYQPASPSFRNAIAETIDLPDVTSLVGPRRQLEALVDECTDRLAPLSRWVGRNPDDRSNLAIAGLLPPELLADFGPPAFGTFGATVESKLAGRDSAIAAATEILGDSLPASGKKQTKKAATESAHLLASAGFGMEPDVRFGGRTLTREDQIVVFPLADGDPESPSEAYAAAALLMHLATMVAAADGEISPEEVSEIRQHSSSSPLLNAGESRRLAAHLKWLLANPPGVAGIKKRVEAMSAEQRQQAGRFLVGIACADGRIEPGEVKSLTKIYRLLELDPASVHQVLHEVSGGERASADPIQVIPPGPTGPEYSIPTTRPDAESREESAKPQQKSGRLDHASIRDKVVESAAVSAMLADIFADPEPEPRAAVANDAGQPSVAGLDGLHSGLLQKLATRDEWPRDEFEALAATHGLMADGALELINDAAFDACDEPLTDGDDPIVLQKDVLQELLT